MTGLSKIFRYAGVAAAYRHRPPYPEEVFTILHGLAAPGPRVVLDLGAGEGALARRLGSWADRVDAVEISPAMVAAGQARPGGDRPHLRWITAAAESAPLDGPYSLITAGASLHWMSWPSLMPRLAGALAPGGVLAIVEHGPVDLPWHDEVVAVIRRHSRSRSYDPAFSLVGALRDGGFLTPLGSATTAPITFKQTIDEYVEQFHSTASLAREHMTPSEAASFGAAIRAAVAPWSRDGALEMPIVATVDWGRPSRLGS